MDKTQWQKVYRLHIGPNTVCCVSANPLGFICVWCVCPWAFSVCVPVLIVVVLIVLAVLVALIVVSFLWCARMRTHVR